MYSALDAVRVITDPHVGVFIHFSAVGIENIIVVAYLREALGADAICKNRMYIRRNRQNRSL